MTITREYLYRWSYKRPGRVPGRYRVRVVNVIASDEDNAVRKAPEHMPGGWIRFEFLGRVD